MECEVNFCIYNRDASCLLDEIGINSLGMCSECIMVSLESNFLEREKSRQLEELERRWADDSVRQGNSEPKDAR